MWAPSHYVWNKPLCALRFRRVATQATGGRPAAPGTTEGSGCWPLTHNLIGRDRVLLDLAFALVL